MRLSKKYKSLVMVSLFGILLIFTFFCSKDKSEEIGKPSEIILKTVRFGMLPYGDHTYAIIGAKQGWFKEVGIDFKYESIKVEEIIPSLKNKTLDVVSCPPGIIFSSYENAENICSFVFGDLFQGYAIMAQSDKGLKSYEEFVQSGMSPNDAIKATVAQLKNKTFAYPTEAAIKPFIDLVLDKGDLSRNNFKSMVLDDPLTVNAMRRKQADFQVGGVPSRIILQREGFKPIISSIDLVKAAVPSADSKELSSILQNGWVTTKEYYEKEHEIILKLASVSYRIMKFMNTNQKEALGFHMPYLTQVSGQIFTEEDGKVIYNSLDPFVTFEDQNEWFHNTKNPLFYKYVNGSILNSFIAQKIYKKKSPNVEDVIYADDVYFELEKLKNESDFLFNKIEKEKMIKNNKSLMEKLNKAKYHYMNYNFLISKQLAEEILKLASK